MAGNPWLEHVRKFWAAKKSTGISYKKALQEAKKTYKKKGSADKAGAKKKRRKQTRK